MSEVIKSHSDEKRSYYSQGGSALPSARPVTARPKPKEIIEIEEKRESLDELLQRPVVIILRFHFLLEKRVEIKFKSI